MAVSRLTSLQSAQWGLTSTEHYYGIAEALFENRRIQDYPSDYNYSDEWHRFACAGQTFSQAAEPGSSKWDEVLHQYLEARSEEQPSELQSLMRISYAVFCLKKKRHKAKTRNTNK